MQMIKMHKNQICLTFFINLNNSLPAFLCIQYETWWNWYLIPVVNFGEVRKTPVSQIHSPHLHVVAPGIVSDLLRFLREWCAESNGKLPHLFSPWWSCSLGSWLLRWKTCLRQNCRVDSCVCCEGPILGQNTLMIILFIIIWIFKNVEKYELAVAWW